MNERIEFPDRVYLNPEIKEMFHALGLIDSYGSGIRRAKAAMEENGSPSLVFGPANDTDALTSVTMRISAELMQTDTRVRRLANPIVDKMCEPKGLSKQQRDEISDEISDEINLTPDEIRLIDTLSKRPRGTYAQFADELGCSEAEVYRLTKTLRSKGILERVGSRKSGQWIVHTVDVLVDEG